MRLAIFGNNNGPLVLLRSMKKAGLPMPEWVVLQKPVASELHQQYRDLLGRAPQLATKESELLAIFASQPPDLLINCFGNFIFREILKSIKVLNIHPSPLPAYRGRHPMHWALIEGEEEFGISIHKMTPQVDQGPIYWQAMVPTQEGWSVPQLRQALLEQLESEFGGFLKSFRWSTAGIPTQKEASYYPPRKPEDSRISNWHDPALVYRKVMALREESFPAYTESNGQKIIFRQAKYEPSGQLVQKVSGDGCRLQINYPSGYRLTLEAESELPNSLKKQIQYAGTLSGS